MASADVTGVVKTAVDELIKAVKAGKSETLKRYLAMAGRFHRYSWRNVLLIMTQRPEATFVAGYGRWRQLGRYVRRGERGIRIVAPVTVRAQNATAEEADERITAFKQAVVFDVAQTDGRPLPEPSKAEGDPGHVMSRLKRCVTERGITLDYSNRIGPAQGMSLGGMILLRKDMDPAEEFSTLTHELAHEILHQGPPSSRADRTVREVEAEAVAFIVCRAVGMEAQEASADYIQLYRGDAKTLMASLQHIQTTARDILGGITGETVCARERIATASVKTAGGRGHSQPVFT